MGKFCPQCGRQSKEKAKFCSGCGSPFRERPAATAPPPPPPTSPGGWRDIESAPAAEAGPSGPTPPQFWESYDYPSPPVGGGSVAHYEPPPPPAYSTEYTYRPVDASRPLPPLSFESSAAPAGARERAREIARNFSLWAAGIVLFPVPFSDLVLLMPVQTAMVISIGKAYGVKDPPEKMLAHIAAACGASVFGQITTLFVSNLIPIIGKLVSAPFVYGWTYGLGEVAMRYFESQGELDQGEMKAIFKQVSKEATRSFRPGDIKQAGESFDHLRDHLSEEDYRKLRARFGNQ